MIVPMLRGDQSKGTRMRAVVLMLGLGVLAAVLVLAGNPGNMGLCGACFLRDLAGALRLHQGPAIVRPEVPGLVLGALLWSLLARRHIGRSGSHAVARLLLCAAMAIGAMVFLGCPFRMLQRLGGGDLNAWLALPGFVVGVGVARWFEQRGYSLGKTQEVPRPIGLLGPLVLFVPLLAWLAGAGHRGCSHSASRCSAAACCRRPASARSARRGRCSAASAGCCGRHSRSYWVMRWPRWSVVAGTRASTASRSPTATGCGTRWRCCWSASAARSRAAVRCDNW
jgi:hypothetical protein